ncbi:MAG TPA: hypothetical protein VME19_00700 [Streptosporangiaceae bacterium]|nr:hypothetical protein [Streptosporangiaceae bacterium]
MTRVLPVAVLALDELELGVELELDEHAPSPAASKTAAATVRSCL